MYCINKKELKLIKEVQLLWMQHSQWTFAAINSIVIKNPNEEEMVNRLLRNPVDFAFMLRRFYGDNIAFRFSDLLTEHLELAAALVQATMENKMDKVQEIRKRWYENAEQISCLLDSINPFWCFESWKDMFFIHLGLAEKIAVKMINKEYTKSIVSYDEFEIEVIMMADMMYEGLLKQFYCYK